MRINKLGERKNMQRISGNWFRISDRREDITKIWPRLEEELKAIGFSPASNVLLGLYRLTHKRTTSNDYNVCYANFEWPQKEFLEKIKIEVISNPSHFLENKMTERHDSEPPTVNLSHSVYLSHLDIIYPIKTREIRFRITPEAFYSKKHDFIFHGSHNSYWQQYHHFVVEVNCEDRDLDASVSGIYRGIRRILFDTEQFAQLLDCRYNAGGERK